jgi:stage V sporulation protein R
MVILGSDLTQLLKHCYEGVELDLKYLEKVLPYVQQLWGGPVHIESMIEEGRMLFSYDRKGIHRKDL